MTALKTIALGLFVALSSFVGAHAQSAIAPDDHLVKASYVYKYSRYYAPYAIQAAAAYLPITDLDATRLQPPDQDHYGADVNYTVQNVFPTGDDKLRARAKDAFKAWQYQFGSDSYLTCIDPADNDCQAAYQNRGWAFSAGPSFQVWARKRFPAGGEGCSEVSIAFRGTVGGISDWASNFDRFGSPYDDYYHQLRRNVDGIIKTIANLDCYKRAKSKPQIVSTGHSLGGGLAQLAALANKTAGPRIVKVFAFDPSPVTGARLVNATLRDANAAGLTVDRIYQEGEVLSYARSAVQEYPPAKSGCNPVVRTVKVDALSSGNSIHLHGMAPLAEQFVQLSYDNDTKLAYATPPTPKGCAIRYQPPTEEDGALVASLRGGQTIASANDYQGYGEQAGASYAYMQTGVPGMRKAGTRIRQAALITPAHGSGRAHAKRFREKPAPVETALTVSGLDQAK